jgi:hypothetical protein
MAKVVVRLPEPKEEYDVSNQKQINRAIAIDCRAIKFYFFKRTKTRSRKVRVV